MRVFIAGHLKVSVEAQLGGQSRCVKCDDDLTIVELIYEQDSDSGIPLKK